MPTRPLWPVKPSPRPAAFAAALTLRPIWLAESPNTGVDGSTTAKPSDMIATSAEAASLPMYRAAPSASGSVFDLRTWRRAEPSSWIRKFLSEQGGAPELDRA